MIHAKRMGVILLALVLTACMGATALAATIGQSNHGAFVAEFGDKVYYTVFTGDVYNLYAVPVDGGEAAQVDSSGALDELTVGDGNLYYLRTNGAARQIVRIDDAGAQSVLCEFENDVTVDHLCWYDDVLYCLAGGHVYIVDPDNGDSIELCDLPVDEFTIVDDVIFYVAGNDDKTYDRTVAGQTDALSQTAGTLWSMSILGTNPEKLVDKGVTDLRANGDNLYFHNLEDNYAMGSADEMWLEGKLYRYNIQTMQMAAMNLDYDWDYYPTDQGVVVYTSQDISLYPVAGGEGVNLMKPELKAAMTVSGEYAYVYEYSSAKLTRLALDATGSTVLVDDSDVLPDVQDETGDTVLVDGGDEADAKNAEVVDQDPGVTGVVDQTYDDATGTVKAGDASSYIFPNSSEQRLTEEQIKAVNKTLWGFARNEIYARHGYTFKSGKYGEYFNAKSWYKAGGFKSSSLSSIEWDNMELLKKLEREYGLLEGSGVSSKSSSSAKNNYYILKEARSKRLTKSYLRKKLGSKSKYALARNEILARHGYVFKTAKYKNYFNNQKWYSAGGYSSGSLSRIEWYNIEQLKDLENE